jgi:hypothetical protein
MLLSCTNNKVKEDLVISPVKFNFDEVAHRQRAPVTAYVKLYIIYICMYGWRHPAKASHCTCGYLVMGGK